MKCKDTAAAAAAVSLHFMARTSWKGGNVLLVILVIGYLIAVGGEGILVVPFAEVGAAEVPVSSTFTCVGIV